MAMQPTRAVGERRQQARRLTAPRVRPLLRSTLRRKEAQWEPTEALVNLSGPLTEEGRRGPLRPEARRLAH